MNQIYRTFSVAFSAGSSGSVNHFASFNVPSGVYRVEVYSQGGGTDASISIDQASIYYQSYDSTKEPVVVALVSPNGPGGNGVLSFTCTAITNNASTSAGFITITPVRAV
jgi:hypothetical protein